MTKKSFEEMVAAAKGIKFPLPHNVKYQKQLLPNGNWNYVFRHDELGELGRILVLPHGTQTKPQTQFSCEVVGDANDPTTEKRRSILEPIAKGILEKMSAICGTGTGELKPYVSPNEQHLVKSMLYPCDICKKATALIIFAPDADTQSRLEDYARLMYAKINELNVPTWIVGTETEYIVSGVDLRQSLVLKTHPKHEKAKIMTPDELMDKVDKLMETHCKK